MRFRSIGKEDYVKGFLSLGAFLLLEIAGSIILTRYAPWGIVAWVALVLVGVVILIRWHSRNYGYKCVKCGHEFAISTFVNCISPHGPSMKGGWKLLKCPECGKWSRASVLKIV
jgi:DNA-directed RNA polymerase subunit RPC12/RpoP